MLGRAVEPPLSHQIAYASRIFAAEAIAADGPFRHRYDLKGEFSPEAHFPLELSMHRLLGLELRAGDEVFVFVTDAGAPLEVLRVFEGRIVYAPNSAAREELSVADFTARVRAGGTT